jgi:hypothetical protein
VLICATRVRTNTKLRTHLCIDSILELFIEFDDWLEEVAGVLIDLIKITSKSMITISFDVFGSGVARCD